MTAPLTYNFPSSNGIDTCQGFIWPAENAKAIVYLTHGMAEHINRYGKMAKFLNDHGYTFCGHDHLGHGHTARDLEHLGYFAEKDGWKHMTNDVNTGMELIHSRYAELPMFAVGFSIGAMLLRLALTECKVPLKGAVLSGCGGMGYKMAAAMTAKVDELIAEEGPMSRSDYMKQFTKSVLHNPEEMEKKPQTKLHRISPDDPNFDPFFSFVPTLSAYADVMQITSHNNMADVSNNTDKNLPILFLSGAKDPMGSYGRLPLRLTEKYKAAGLSDVHCTIYPELSHQVFSAGGEVFTDMLKWLDAHI